MRTKEISSLSKNYSKTNYISFGHFFIFLALAIVTSLTYYNANVNKHLTLKTIFLLIFSLCVTVILFYLIVMIFGRLNFKKGIFDFLIGDEGTYSLSRLQAVLWAVVIISYQLGVFIVFFRYDTKFLDRFSYYQLVFSESAIWLLGLTLSSYIITKGITYSNIQKDPSLYKRKDKPEWSDIVTGDNGLDFSRCQMLIWTLVGLIVFYSKCYYFLKHLELLTDAKAISNLFNHFYDEYSSDPKKYQVNTASPFVPYLPYSFVVLMGLSQGVYVGKKLVPTFKLDDVKEGKKQELEKTLIQLNIKKTLLAKIVINSKDFPKSNLDIKNVNKIKAELSNLEFKIQELTNDIAQISSFQTTTGI